MTPQDVYHLITLAIDGALYADCEGWTQHMGEAVGPMDELAQWAEDLRDAKSVWVLGEDELLTQIA